MWQKLIDVLSWGRNSATHAWSNLVIAVSALVAALAQFADQLAGVAADLFGDPELKAQIISVIPHDSVPLVVIAIMLITELARNRTLK
jgi:hypothetical protein